MDITKLANVTTGLSYGTAGIGGGFWVLNLVDLLDANQWAGVGVIFSIVLGLITGGVNLYFKVKEDKRRKESHKVFLSKH